MTACEVCGRSCNSKYSVCRENEDCRREYHRRAWRKYQDAIRAGTPGRAREDRSWDVILEQTRARMQDDRERRRTRRTVGGAARSLFRSARSTARSRGLPFDLTVEWVESDLRRVLARGCPLLGIEITLNTGPRSPGAPTIDRFRPELGYTQANCWAISFRANRMKQDASLDFMRRILEYADTRFAV